MAIYAKAVWHKRHEVYLIHQSEHITSYLYFTKLLKLENEGNKKVITFNF